MSEDFETSLPADQFRLTCVHCQRTFRVLRQQLGDVVACPHCQGRNVAAGSGRAETTIEELANTIRSAEVFTAPANDPPIKRGSIREHAATVILVAMLSVAAAIVAIAYTRHYSKQRVVTWKQGQDVIWKDAGLRLSDLIVTEMRKRPPFVVVEGKVVNVGKKFVEACVVRMSWYADEDKTDAVQSIEVPIERLKSGAQHSFRIELKEYEPFWEQEYTKAELVNWTTQANAPPSSLAIVGKKTVNVIGIVLRICVTVVGPFLVLMVMGYIGGKCAESRARWKAGFWLGVLLGPAGWLIALLLPTPLAEYRTFKPTGRGSPMTRAKPDPDDKTGARPKTDDAA